MRSMTPNKNGRTESYFGNESQERQDPLRVHLARGRQSGPGKVIRWLMVRAGLRRVRLRSTPIAEELDPIPHAHVGSGRAKTQNAVQLLAHREPLLRR